MAAIVITIDDEKKEEIKSWLRANVLDDGNTNSIQEFCMEVHNKIRRQEKGQ